MPLVGVDAPLNIEATSKSATMIPDQMAKLRSIGLLLGSCSSFIITALFFARAKCSEICS
jgi:hypothetical protein